MRIRLTLAALIAVAGSVALSAPTPASACPGWPCDTVNDVCALVKHPHCVM